MSGLLAITSQIFSRWLLCQLHRRRGLRALPPTASGQRLLRPRGQCPARARWAITRPNKSTVIVFDEVVERFNALLQFAQQFRESDRLTYEVSVRDFERMVGHTSTGNREYLRGGARSIVAVQVEFDYRTKKGR